jgi:type I restriction enzyme S subunit
MVSEYPITKLGSVAHIIMGQSPPGSTYNEVGDGLPFYQGVVDFGTRHPSPRVYCSEPTRIAEAGDILFSVRAPIGRVNVATERCCIGRGLAVIRLEDELDRIFVECVLKGMSNRWAVFEGGGSVFGNARKEDLQSLEIIWPAPEVRRAIAAILGTLDDKIELNRRMNQTLEAMAQALLKSWFVDFEPFRDQGMQDSPLGEIPVGWRVGKLSELCTTQYGYTASAIEEPVGPRLLRVMDINKQNWIEWDKVPYCEITEDDIAKYRLEVGDLVVARMADPGKSAIIEQPVEAVFASYLVRLKTESLAHAYFVYGFLKSQAYADYSEGAMGGSSVQKSMNAKVIVDVDLVIPPPQVLKLILQHILPLRKRLVANVDQSANLATIRDTLLPKLLSGEIRVKDAEKLFREAV